MHPRTASKLKKAPYRPPPLLAAATVIRLLPFSLRLYCYAAFNSDYTFPSPLGSFNTPGHENTPRIDVTTMEKK